ncbi:MAG: ATP-binding protein [Epsilonproteobacteria bacterium]|nr:ATP-binding protein [Campylobacterota bacterium]
MIINRNFWQALIERSWKERSVIWLMGVRRVGKTSLCQSLDNIEYFDCESPRVRQMLVDPESFLEGQENTRVVLDEIHRLDNPSEVLKLAADHYPTVKIIATGSSTLGASAKFKDTLTGRKIEIWLSPMLFQDLALFGNTDLNHRFLFGGLPSFFTAKQVPEKYFQEWIDAYWAKDIQDIFSIGKRFAFQKFAELLLANSGGLFEATRYTAPCEVSRATISNYLNVLEETFVVHVLRPFSTHKPTEIVMAPKVYGFDTGFVCYAQGKTALRAEDVGFMWEHCVLNEMLGRLQMRTVHYWRNKSGHEIDFVIQHRKNKSITAIECKFLINQDAIALKALIKNFTSFRRHYPIGENIVVASNIEKMFKRKIDDITITFLAPDDLIDLLDQ